MRNSCSSCLEIAFLAAGRLRLRMRIRPVFGAGRSVRFIHGACFVEYSRIAEFRRIEDLVRGIGCKRCILVDV